MAAMHNAAGHQWQKMAIFVVDACTLQMIVHDWTYSVLLLHLHHTIYRSRCSFVTRVCGK